MSASDEREHLAARIRGFLPSTEVRELRMFGGIGFMVREALAIVAERGGSVLVRTEPSVRADRLARGAISAVMGNGRMMGDAWLRVPAEQLGEDAELADWVAIGIHAGDVLHGES